MGTKRALAIARVLPVRGVVRKVREVVLIGQTRHRSYDEQQRVPGDYDERQNFVAICCARATSDVLVLDL